MSHERHTADERYESVVALFDSGAPTVRQPYGVAYRAKLTDALTVQKGGLRKLGDLEAVIVTKRNENVTVQRDGSVHMDGEYVGEFEYVFRLGENNE